jgi:hypothetical protein
MLSTSSPQHFPTSFFWGPSITAHSAITFKPSNNATYSLITHNSSHMHTLYIKQAS